MSKKQIYTILTVVMLAGLGVLANFYWKNLRGIGPVIKPPPKDITDASFNTTGLPLSLPPGFSISIFAKDLPGARVMEMGQDGMWVSQTGEGQISFLEFENGKVSNQDVIFRNLNNPHGLAFDPQDSNILYIAEEHSISKVQVDYLTPALSDIGEGERVRLGTPQKIADLPSDKGHFTRTIAFGPDDRLYVSIGSSCNVCEEKDSRRAAIYSMNRDGSDFRLYATGLRNAVFFDWSYVDGRMWATEMGRDMLGDDLPPDEINIIKESANYGWPYAYGNNINDETVKRSPLLDLRLEPAFINLPAHSAPLGLAFVPEEGWPEEYWYDLLVAFHGSWNRSEPTGYKIMRIKLDEKGNYEGMDSTGSPQAEDFITGWLTDEGALGRPVDILVQPGGVMYLSDDKAGVIYKITYNHNEQDDLIRIDSPKTNEIVKSPLIVQGAARGTWYFEASFPVRILDANGNQVSSGIAQAQSDWMTEDFVPFRVELGFAPPQTDTGFLVLEKDNPSGLPENAAELRIPVRFKP